MLDENSKSSVQSNKLVRGNLRLSAGVQKRNGVCSKGDPPWTYDWLRSELRHFLHVYDQRLGDNMRGTPLMHQFAVWSIVRALKPRHIIESGIMNGLGTWIVRQAAPDAQLILLDPSTQLDLTYRDTHDDTFYFTGRNFRDFSSMPHWNDVTIDVNRTLAFIDDHHTPLRRIAHARRVGIRHMIFEDNYWLGFADCFSLKQACACVMGEQVCNQFKYRDAFGLQTRALRADDVTTSARIFSNMRLYAEFPMIWNVWHPGVTMISKESRNFLFPHKNGSQLLREHGLTRFPPKSQLNGYYTYGNVALIELVY